MAILQIEVASGAALAVHRFIVQESISDLFAVTLGAASENPTVDLEAIIGQPASFRVVSGCLFAKNGGARLWTGILRSIDKAETNLARRGCPLPFVSMARLSHTVLGQLSAWYDGANRQANAVGNPSSVERSSRRTWQ